MKKIIVSPKYFEKEGGVVRIVPPKKNKYAVENVLIEHYEPYVTLSLARTIRKHNYFCFIHKERFYDDSVSYTVVISAKQEMSVFVDNDHDWELCYQRYDVDTPFAFATIWPDSKYYIASDIYGREISIGSKDEFKIELSSTYEHMIASHTDSSGMDIIESSIKVLERDLD